MITLTPRYIIFKFSYLTAYISDVPNNTTDTLIQTRKEISNFIVHHLLTCLSLTIFLSAVELQVALSIYFLAMRLVN